MVLKNVVFYKTCIVGIARSTRAAGRPIHPGAGEVGGFVPGARVKILLPGSVISAAVEQVCHLAAGEFLGGFAFDICPVSASNGSAGVLILVIIAVSDCSLSAATAAHTATIIIDAGIVYSSAAGTVGNCAGIYYCSQASTNAANTRATFNHAAAEAVCYRAGIHLTAHTADITAGEVGIRYDHILNGRVVQIAKQTDKVTAIAVQSRNGMSISVKGDSISILLLFSNWRPLHQAVLPAFIQGAVRVQNAGVYRNIRSEDGVFGVVGCAFQFPIDQLGVPVQLVHIGDLPIAACTIAIRRFFQADVAISVVVVVRGAAALFEENLLAAQFGQRITIHCLTPAAILIQQVGYFAALEITLCNTCSGNRAFAGARFDIAVGNRTAAGQRCSAAAGGIAVLNGAGVAAAQLHAAGAGSTAVGDGAGIAVAQIPAGNADLGNCRRRFNLIKQAFARRNGDGMVLTVKAAGEARAANRRPAGIHLNVCRQHTFGGRILGKTVSTIDQRREPVELILRTDLVFAIDRFQTATDQTSALAAIGVVVVLASTIDLVVMRFLIQLRVEFAARKILPPYRGSIAQSVGNLAALELGSGLPDYIFGSTAAATGQTALICVVIAIPHNGVASIANHAARISSRTAYSACEVAALDG